MSQVDDNFKREITRRMVADAAWKMISDAPHPDWLSDQIEAGRLTLDELVLFFKEELQKIL